MTKNKANRRNLLFLLLVLVLSTVFYFFYAQEGISIHFSPDDGMLTLNAPDNASAMPINADTEIAYSEDFDRGEAVSGDKTWQGTCYGIWENDSLGTYEAFLSPRVKAAITVKNDDQICAFSLANAQTLRSLYEQLIAFQNGELS